MRYHALSVSPLEIKKKESMIRNENLILIFDAATGMTSYQFTEAFE